MNAGLSNLTKLKQHLLPDSWQTESQLDDLLVALGLGIAAQLEEACGGRKFARVEDDTFELKADTRLVQLPRFPIEGTPALTIRFQGNTEWESNDGWIDQVVATSGMLELLDEPGTCRDRLRVTYTGGYWWDQSEDASEVQPEGSTALPASLQFAWLMQCKHVFAASEAMMRRALASDTEQAKAENADYAYQLLPAVEKALNPFRLLAA